MDLCTHHYLVHLTFWPCQFLPCWGTAQSVVAGFFLPSRQLSNGVWKTAGTCQALFHMVTSTIETPQSLVMPNAGQRQLYCHAFSSTITPSSTLFPSTLTRKSSPLSEHWSTLEIKCSCLLAGNSDFNELFEWRWEMGNALFLLLFLPMLYSSQHTHCTPHKENYSLDSLLSSPSSRV